MKNKTIVIAIVIVLILIAGIWLLMGKKNNGAPESPAIGRNPQNQAAAGGNSVAQNNSNTFAGTLSDLMAKKTPVNCQVSFDQNGMTQTQSMYFDGSNLRTDVVMNVAGQQNTAHVVLKDGWEYMWSEGGALGAAANMGTKINVSEMKKQQAQAASGTPQNNRGLDIQRTMNFACSPWVPDATKFALPTDIQFQDMTSLGPSAGTVPAAGVGGTPAAPANLCDVCKNIPAGSARTQCETSCASAPKQ